MNRSVDASFVQLVGEELPRLQRIARLLTGTPEAADDLVAETLSRVLPKWRDGAVTDPSAYLRRVMVNLTNRQWRRRAVGRRRDHAALGWLPAGGDDAEEIAEHDRTLRAVLALPPRRRAVVVLRFYDDLPEARIAEVMGISLGTVKSSLARGLEQLRAALGSREGV